VKINSGVKRQSVKYFKLRGAGLVCLLMCDLCVTRKPLCLSAVAVAMICLKQIPVATPSQPLCAV